MAIDRKPPRRTIVQLTGLLLLIAGGIAAPRPTAAESALDLTHPAVVLTAALEQARRLGPASPGLPAAAGSSDPRRQLAAALAELIRGERGAARRLAATARARAEKAGEQEATAFALLLMHFTEGGWRTGRDGTPIDAAADLYAWRGNREGQQLALALKANRLAARLALLPPSASGPVVSGVERLVAAVEAGPAVPLADLNAANAGLAVGRRLVGDAAQGGWLARAARLAERAGQGVEPSALLGLAAANQGMEARLLGLQATNGDEPVRGLGHQFAAYDTSLNQAILDCDEPAALLLAADGLATNLSLYSPLLTRLSGDRQLPGRFAKRLLMLTQASMPLAEEPVPGYQAAVLLLGGAEAEPHESGMSACRMITRWLGNGVPDENPEMGSYQDFAFWFYEQTKTAATARMLARLTGEGRLSGTDQRRLAELRSERLDLAVDLLHTAAGKVAAMRETVAATRGGSGPVRGGTRGGRAQRGGSQRSAEARTAGNPFERYQAARRELLALELGNDAEARATAEVLSRRMRTADVQAMLPDDHSAILAYGLDWAFVITRKQVAWRFPEPPGQPREVMQQVGLIGNPDAPTADRLAASSRLYEAYFRPVEGDLAGIDRLVLVAGGALSCLPFEALVTGARGRAGTPRNWTEAEFVGDRFACEYVPSLTGMALARARDQRADHEVAKGVLAVGDVQFGQAVALDDDTRFVLVPTRSGSEDELLALPFTGLEARAVVQAVGLPESTLLLGGQATLPAVERELPRHRLVHFATHGVVSPDDPLGAGLLLSPGADGQAGVLTARQVYSLRLPARLAVLSACDTARGQLRYVSGGVTSLAGAFLYAGVPSVVASLWPVDDQATAGFMTTFYHQDLRRSAGDGTTALREAKRELRTGEGGKYADPYYWAAFLMFH